MWLHFSSRLQNAQVVLNSFGEVEWPLLDEMFDYAGSTDDVVKFLFVYSVPDECCWS